MNTPDNPADELVIIEDVAQGLATAASRDTEQSWRILIVDDDEEVHRATLFALEDVQIDGWPLTFLHAYTAAGALDILKENDDIAVMLLDVVMEHESAGLDLVRKIRETLGRQELRIVLRTGQPGYAPELSVIRDYDINDYKTKSELTRVRLLTTLTTAIRSYHQIRTISAGRRGLSMIVHSATDLFSRRALKGYAEGVLIQLSALLRLRPEGILCAHIDHDYGHDGDEEGIDESDLPPRIVGAAGKFSKFIDQPLEVIGNTNIIAAVRECLRKRCNLFNAKGTVLYFDDQLGHCAAVYLATNAPLSETDRQLLAVFSVSIRIGLENVRLFSDLNFFAYSDPLTHLPNRIAFTDSIDARIEKAMPAQTVAFVDIDRFSAINDALGPQKGDEILMAVAGRLKTMFATTDVLLARIGGDVFGLLGPDRLLNPQHLIELFAPPVNVDEYALPLQVTIGLTRFGDVGEQDGPSLFKATNIALNRAKTSRRGHWYYYSQDMSEATHHRLSLLHALREAISDDRGLTLSYQPQINIADGRIVGAEALIRWRGEDGKPIAPDSFISIAEYSGLIRELGYWVFRTAIAQLAQWERGPMRGLRLAVNVSLAQFHDPQFVGRIRAGLEEFGVSPSQIELEITESVAMFEAEMVISVLMELKNLGVKIAIDDFGTGFSSLAYLHRLPTDRLKIDRTFVNELGDANSSGTKIARTIVRLGQSLGLSVIAEGVETAEQEAQLKELGCLLAQGYLYSPAIPADAFLEWCRAHVR